MAQEVVLGNVYDLSKNIVGQFKPLNALELASAQIRIEEWLNTNLDDLGVRYWMLLCRERNDYTVFAAHPHINQPMYDTNGIAGEIIGCASDRGEILDICLDEHETAYEIWVNTTDDSEIHAYLLFPYNQGVIER